MAHKRKRGNTWHYVVRNSKLLDKPLYLSFADEAEGDAYCEQLKRLLAQGIVPEAVRERTRAPDATITIAALIREYLSAVAVSDADSPILDRQVLSLGGMDVRQCNHDWADSWVTSMKRADRLAPSTIRHHVGALARALDHGVRRGYLAVNPLRNLRRGYATYSDDDGVAAGGKVVEKKREERMPATLATAVAEYLDDPQINQAGDLQSFFTVALETGMRLAELHTLRTDNVHLTRRLVRLERTKNGTTRDVPLSPGAIEALRGQIAIADVYVWPWFTGKLSALEVQRPGNPGNWKKAKTQTTNMLSTRWIRIFTACGAPGYSIHWVRHEAASRIFQDTKMPDREIMKMFGWSDWKMVDRYTHLRASESADYLG